MIASVTRAEHMDPVWMLSLQTPVRRATVKQDILTITVFATILMAVLIIALVAWPEVMPTVHVLISQLPELVIPAVVPRGTMLTARVASSRVVVPPLLLRVMLSAAEHLIIKICARFFVPLATQERPLPLLASQMEAGPLLLDALSEAVRLRRKPATRLTLGAVRIKLRVLASVPRDIWELRAASRALLMAVGLLHKAVPS